MAHPLNPLGPKEGNERVRRGVIPDAAPASIGDDLETGSRA
jgi:hypothetical protein